MAILIAIELVALSFVMETISSVRTLVGAEGNWSKAQKDAVASLQEYIISKENTDYNKFLKYLQVPLGYRKARVEIDNPEPNMGVVYDGLVQGKIHNDDIKGVIHLLRRFKTATFVQDSFKDWQTADGLITELMAIGAMVRNNFQTNTPFNVRTTMNQINGINGELTTIESHFSATLRSGSRRVERIFWVILLVLVLTIEASGLSFVFNFSKHLSQGLNELNRVAVSVGEGNFNQQVNIQTQDELGQLANSINKMVRSLKSNIGYRIKAENQNRAKNLFLASMSHEIRTPLGAILGFSELLQQEGLSTEEKHQYQRVIKDSGKNLTNIITDILDISRIESGHLAIKNISFSLHDLLSDVQNLFALKCKERDLHLEITKSKDLPPQILSDPIRIKQILTNLLNNAIKFTPPKGTISIHASKNNNNIVFDIKDTGCGIKQKDWQSIFEPYMQAENNPQQIGTGLGLAISKHLAQALGGDLALIDSKEHIGSHFRVEILYVLPITKQNTEFCNSNQKINLQGIRVLVVEDGDVSRLLVKTLLEKRGCLVDMAENGIIALNMVKNKKYDVILMDIQMPMMDGYEATHKLREEMHLSTPIIALTAHSMKEDEQRCLESGFSDYLSKPIQTEDLYKKIYKNIS